MLCSAAAVELKPARVVSSRVTTCTGETELNTSRLMREPVTVTVSRLVALDFAASCGVSCAVCVEPDASWAIAGAAAASSTAEARAKLSGFLPSDLRLII